MSQDPRDTPLFENSFNDVRPLLSAYQVPAFDDLEDQIMARWEAEQATSLTPHDPPVVAGLFGGWRLLWGGLAAALCLGLVWLDEPPQRLGYHPSQPLPPTAQKTRPHPRPTRVARARTPRQPVGDDAMQRLIAAVSTFQIVCSDREARARCLRQAQQIGLVTQLPAVQIPRYEEDFSTAPSASQPHAPMTPESFHRHTQPGG